MDADLHTTRLKGAIVEARSIAKKEGSPSVQPHHLARGLLELGEGAANRAINKLDIDRSTLRSLLRERRAANRSGEPDGLSDASTRVLERAENALGVDVVDTAALLSALLSDERLQSALADSVAVDKLQDQLAEQTQVTLQVKPSGENGPSSRQRKVN